jgi:voltage-gated potassium channel
MITSSIVQGRFQFLLATLLFLFAVTPFFDSPVLFNAVTTTITIVALASVIEKRRLFVICIAVGAISVVSAWTAQRIPAKGIGLFANVADSTFIAIVGSVILTYVFNARRITRETIAGAICVFLLIGLLWGNVFHVLQTLDPGSFSNVEEGEPANLETPPSQLSALFNYFSFVTLSTLGYGDITPLTRPAKSLAALEAILGQLYLAVLIARLVGQQVSRRESVGE